MSRHHHHQHHTTQVTTVPTQDYTINHYSITENKKTKASMRWKLLKNFLLKKQTSNNESSMSVTRCVSSYGWLDQKYLEQYDGSQSDKNNHSEYRMACFSLKENNLSINLRLKTGTTMQDLDVANKDHIDNTGNVCVWPSEEILAHYCINYLGREFFENKRVLEIGCGVGVGGLLIAKYFPSIISEIVLTDGNATVISNLQHNIEEIGELEFGQTNVTCSQLLWQDEKAIENIGQFDVILGADCLFFESFHSDLVRLLKKVGEKTGATVVMFNPRRGKSLDNFLTIFNQQCPNAIIKLEERYDERTFEKHLSFVTENPLYCKENHYPLLMKINF